jgi:preprotein translocase subunit YajC
MEVSIIFFVVVLAAFFLLIVLPQRRRNLARQQFLAQLEVSDEVITNGGIYGTILELDEQAVDLQVADGVVLHVARAAIFQDAPPDPGAGTPGDEAPGDRAEDGS